MWYLEIEIPTKTLSIDIEKNTQEHRCLLKLFFNNIIARVKKTQTGEEHVDSPPLPII